MDTTGMMGLFICISRWVFRFTSVNLLWMIFNIPILYLVFNILLVSSKNNFMVLSLSIIVMAPFVFFPATTAMFALIRQWIFSEELLIFKTYVQYYKTNYLNSMLGGGVISFLMIVFFIDYYYLINVLNFSSIIFLIIFFIFIYILAVFTLHFFSITVHMDMKLRTIVKTSLLITIGNPILTLTLGGISFLIIYVSLTFFTFLIPFFMGSLIAYIAFTCFLNVYNKIQLIQENV